MTAPQSPTAARTDLTRLYAIDLLNRVTPDHFDYEDVAIIARLIPLIEGDLATWLEGQLRGTVSRTLIASRVRAGLHRAPVETPPAPTQPPALSLVVGEKGLGDVSTVSSSTTERTSK